MDNHMAEDIIIELRKMTKALKSISESLRNLEVRS